MATSKRCFDYSASVLVSPLLDLVLFPPIKARKGSIEEILHTFDTRSLVYVQYMVSCLSPLLPRSTPTSTPAARQSRTIVRKSSAEPDRELKEKETSGGHSLEA